MTALDYYAFIWDVTGPDYRAYLCRLTGLNEIYSEFKWTELDDRQREKVGWALKSIVSLHQGFRQMDQRQNQERATGTL